jgi:hypothetical protein
LGRAPDEPVNQPLRRFYTRLLEILRRPIVRHGRWQLLECTPAWEGNASSDNFVAYVWEDSHETRLLITVNYADHPSQCYVRLPFGDLAASRWQLNDLFGDARYERDGRELQAAGFYLDVPAWQYHAFEIQAH